MTAADPRSLGLLRITLGAVLIADALRRLVDAPTWYANGGLLPNHVMLWRPLDEYVFSFLFAASTTPEAVVGLLLCLGVFVAFTLGWKTRLFQVLAWLCVVSLHGRVILLENGGDVVLGLLAFWTMFLPLGRRFSIDALRASLRADDGRDIPSLGAAADRPLDTRPVVSIAVAALLLQMATIYAFNALNKFGPEWHDGSAVYFALHQDRVVTHLGVWMRESLPAPLLRAASWGSIVAEFALPALLLTPWFQRRARHLAIALVFSLHFGFALCMNLGLFSMTMWSWLPVLLGTRDWRRSRAASAPCTGSGSSSTRARPRSSPARG